MAKERILPESARAAGPKQERGSEAMAKERILPESADVVNHPAHYQSASGLEVIDVIEAFTSDLKGIEAVDTGNAIKYITRWKKKNGVEDLRKAVWCIKHLINHLENKEEQE